MFQLILCYTAYFCMFFEYLNIFNKYKNMIKVSKNNGLFYVRLFTKIDLI